MAEPPVHRDCEADLVWPDEPPAAEAAALRLVQRRVALAVRRFIREDVGPLPDLPRGPTIHAANHRSLADLLFSASTFSAWDRPIRPLVAGAYFDMPAVGRLLRALRCIPVYGTEALDHAAAALAEGWSIAIMPEGRVVPEADWRHSSVGRAHSGIGRLAIDTGLPVVVSGVSGTEQVWPADRSIPRLRPWRRFHVVLRSEFVGVVPDERSREATARIMEAMERCVVAAEYIAGRSRAIDST